jgi:hypothetical protein
LCTKEIPGRLCMIEIVCYMGGTCGDLITALFDSRDCSFNISSRTMSHTADRSKLKKPHLFKNNSDKDQYCININTQYNSIPSHDIDYHIDRKHAFIGITVTDYNTALWASNRFKKAHKSRVWEEMQARSGVSSVEDYAQMMIDYSSLVRSNTDRILTLESIITGQVADEMKKMLGIELDPIHKNLYSNWMNLQRDSY